MKKSIAITMKTVFTTSLLSIMLTASACNPPEKSGTINMETDNGKPKTEKTDEVKTATVLFEKDKVYEIVFFSVTKGKEKQIFEEYLPKMQPYFEKYGRKSIGMFQVTENRSEVLKSEMIGVFEWPNYEAKEALEADADFKKISTLRDGAFSFFKGGWFATEENKAVTFRSDKAYEFAGASLFETEEAKKKLGEYFKVSEPIKRNYGGAYPEFLVKFAPSNSNGTATYTHHMQLIVEWDSVEDNKKLFA
ncbi:MAG: DUF1330 domain-containing protein, partial [Flavobacteriales bacterium]|nr:DUF1330 domain-containing protein [Flavobacteriales bacterium]